GPGDRQAGRRPDRGRYPEPAQGGALPGQGDPLRERAGPPEGREGGQGEQGVRGEGLWLRGVVMSGASGATGGCASASAGPLNARDWQSSGACATSTRR